MSRRYTQGKINENSYSDVAFLLIHVTLLANVSSRFPRRKREEGGWVSIRAPEKIALSDGIYRFEETMQRAATRHGETIKCFPRRTENFECNFRLSVLVPAPVRLPTHLSFSRNSRQHHLAHRLPLSGREGKARLYFPSDSGQIPLRSGAHFLRASSLSFPRSSRRCCSLFRNNVDVSGDFPPAIGDPVGI